MSELSNKQVELGVLADDATEVLEEAGVGYVVIVVDTDSGARALATNIPADMLDEILKGAMAAPFLPDSVKLPTRKETN